MNNKSFKILVVGGHIFGSLPEQWLKKRGYSVDRFDSEENCFKELSDKPCHLLVVAANGSADKFVKLLQKIPQERQLLLPMLVIVQNSDVTASIKAAKAGATEVLEEPLEELKFINTVELMLKNQKCNRSSAPKPLTLVEKQVLKMVLNGHSSREIAEKMDRSPRTIECHRSQIMQKIGVDNVVDLAKYAIQAGLIVSKK